MIWRPKKPSLLLPRRSLLKALGASLLTMPGSNSPADLLLHGVGPAPQPAAGGGSIAFGAVTRGADTTNSATLIVSHTASGSNRIALVYAYINGAGDVPPTNLTLTYGGNAVTEILDATPYQGVRYTLGYILNPPTGAQNVQCSITGGGAPDVRGLIVMSYTGVNQGAPIGTPLANAAVSGTTPTIALAAPTSTSVSAAFLMGFSQTGPITPGANQTVRLNEYNNLVATMMVQATDKLGTNGGTMTWTKNTNWEYTEVGVELKVA